MLRGWSGTTENKSKMADGRHLEEIDKSQYLRKRLTNFDKIWHDDASGTLHLVGR